MRYPMINLDMDGVGADFDGHYEILFGSPPRSHTDEQLWENINGHPQFFRTIPKFAGIHRLFEVAKQFQHSWLTACPKTSYSEVALQKRAWLDDHQLRADHTLFLPVMGGKNKFLFMQEKGDVLIDDFKENIDLWIQHGGRGILFTSVDQAIHELSKIIQDIEEENT